MTKTTLSVASTQKIRSNFPALNRQHNDHQVVYFDGPGAAQVPRAVAAAIGDYLFHHNANTHWAYPTSAETDQLLLDARQTFADFFNCQPAAGVDRAGEHRRITMEHTGPAGPINSIRKLPPAGQNV